MRLLSFQFSYKIVLPVYVIGTKIKRYVWYVIKIQRCRSAVFLPYRSYFTIMETSEHEQSRGSGGTLIKVKRRIGDNECQRVVCGWTVWQMTTGYPLTRTLLRYPPLRGERTRDEAIRRSMREAMLWPPSSCLRLNAPPWYRCVTTEKCQGLNILLNFTIQTDNNQLIQVYLTPEARRGSLLYLKVFITNKR